MSDDGVRSVVFAGLGGQGVLKASDILAEAAFLAGYDVKKAEVHGMSQRGGSVSSDVRFGTKVLSPMAPDGEVDCMVILEPTQEEPVKHRIGSRTTVLHCDRIKPEQLENRRSINVAMLGMLSTHLPIALEHWQNAIRGLFRPDLVETNLKAFEVGRAASVS